MCICPHERKLAKTIAGIASSVVRYADCAELKVKLIDSLAEQWRAADREDPATDAWVISKGNQSNE